MKWLFAALVALNLMVFGGMITYRLNHSKTPQTSAPVESGAYELARPEALRPRQEAPVPADDAQPDWLHTDPAQAALPEPESEEAAAERRKQEEARREKEKKEREEKARREKEKAAAQTPAAATDDAKNNPKNNTANNTANHAARQCTANASVTLDEDDYHRIKGLLTRWPHAASRSVERRPQKETAAAKTFRVILPAGSDAMNQLEALGNKGFNGSLHNGDISLGVMKSRSSAQVLISRLSAAGFGGARITEQEEKSPASEGALSISRMTVVFMAVDEKDAQDIRNIVGRYGNLNMKNCK